MSQISKFQSSCIGFLKKPKNQLHLLEGIFFSSLVATNLMKFGANTKISIVNKYICTEVPINQVIGMSLLLYTLYEFTGAKLLKNMPKSEFPVVTLILGNLSAGIYSENIYKFTSNWTIGWLGGRFFARAWNLMTEETV